MAEQSETSVNHIQPEEQPREKLQSPSSVQDIASTPQQSPVQPVLNPFPSTRFGHKTRCFNPQFYSKYEWLEYSVVNDAIYCYACRFFAHGNSKADDRFVRIGYRDWKHATGKGGGLDKHHSSKNHQTALLNWSTFKDSISSGTSIASQLDSSRKEQIRKNRHYLKSLLHALMFCASQDIALRGHRESVSSPNKGNFLELLDLIAIHDPIVHDRLINGPNNAIYTSYGIQNHLLHLLGERLRNGICHLVRSAKMYTILVDETKDFSKQEQMSFVVRYVDMSKGEIHEHFLTYVEAKSLDAASLSNYIKNLLIQFNLNWSVRVTMEQA